MYAIRSYYVFNAETLIIGLISGTIGVIASLLISIPINVIVEKKVKIAEIASLPLIYSIALIAGSMILTLIAGLIPSRMAAKKDPVVALRTE